MDTIKNQQITDYRNRLQVSLENRDILSVHYTPSTERALFDVCDLNGRILLTGEIKEEITQVEITDLYPDQYILLVLDGDKVCSTKFALDE